MAVKYYVFPFATRTLHLVVFWWQQDIFPLCEKKSNDIISHNPQSKYYLCGHKRVAIEFQKKKKFFCVAVFCVQFKNTSTNIKWKCQKTYAKKFNLVPFLIPFISFSLKFLQVSSHLHISFNFFFTDNNNDFMS